MQRSQWWDGPPDVSASSCGLKSPLEEAYTASASRCLLPPFPFIILFLVRAGLSSLGFLLWSQGFLGKGVLDQGSMGRP